MSTRKSSIHSEIRMPMPPNEKPVIAISTMAVAKMSTIMPPQTSSALYSGHASSAPIKPPPLQSSELIVNERTKNTP